MSASQNVMEELQHLTEEGQLEVLSAARAVRRREEAESGKTETPDTEQVAREASLGHS
ncbi:hypothetical protein [Marinobacter sp.]|uniref:hypothetical protein n=1 Tax=Marinobacter sp. TaxID=50741 RepID=UPI00384ECB2D